MQKKLFFLGGGTQNKGNERSAKILDFKPLHKLDPKTNQGYDLQGGLMCSVLRVHLPLFRPSGLLAPFWD